VMAWGAGNWGSGAGKKKTSLFSVENEFSLLKNSKSRNSKERGKASQLKVSQKVHGGIGRLPVTVPGKGLEHPNHQNNTC